jgi:hypothetical protein
MWQSFLELNQDRTISSGSEAALSDAIRRGADLRVYTQFRYNEHIDVDSDNTELVQEVSEFRVTYLLNDSWVAGIMNLRQPIEPPNAFGPRPSMSFFLYNQNGQQAIARPYLDGQATSGVLGASLPAAPEGMPKYHARDSFDAGTNAPSSNFVYEFERYRYFVNDSWREVLAHNADGGVLSGSFDELVAAFAAGSEVKVAVRNLCSDLSRDSSPIVHELFIQVGPCYYNTESKIFSAGSHPIVRVAPNIPLRYESRNWDFGWLMLRSDGEAHYRRCDPYSLQFEDRKSRYALRWFIRS